MMSDSDIRDIRDAGRGHLIDGAPYRPQDDDRAAQIDDDEEDADGRRDGG